MIHIQPKQYQVVVWRDETRLSGEPALRIDFDTIEDATAALRAHQATGYYRSGVLMEWRKHSAIWNLLEQYP